MFTVNNWCLHVVTFMYEMYDWNRCHVSLSDKMVNVLICVLSPVGLVDNVLTSVDKTVHS